MPTLRHVFVVNIHYICQKKGGYECFSLYLLKSGYECFVWENLLILCLEISNFMCFSFFILEEVLHLLMVWLIQLYMYETDLHYAYRTRNWICWLSLTRHEQQMIARILYVVASSYKQYWKTAVTVCSSVYYSFPMPENSVYVAAPCSRPRLKCDGTHAETRFCLSVKRTSTLKSAGWLQFIRLPAAEVCASAVLMVVMLDTPCSEVVRRVLATHLVRQFPLHLPSRASLCAITFQLDSTCCWSIRFSAWA
jgi:hypothetical protein